ncbi:MAG: hypothetical protein GKR89_37485 [Candidatus Latescibacteria bacterium]|nr:hypothetical protein [Candidatus Latescibacterota bacterium]
MSAMRPSTRPFLLVLLLATPLVAQTPATVHIGLVLDGPHQPYRNEVAQFHAAVAELTRGAFDVRFDPALSILADGTAQGVEAALDRLLEAPQVNLIIAAGPLASHAAGRRGPLPKPVIATSVINPKVQGIPLQEGSSGVKNLNYITFPSDVQRDLKTCLEIAPFTKAALLYSQAIGQAIPDLWDHYLAQGHAAGIEGVPIPVGDSVASTLAALPDDIEAVFVALPLALTPTQFEELAAGLIERGLPSFSALGVDQVEAGLMVGLHPDSDISRLVRRLALHTQRILLGDPPESLPVVFSRSEHITINMATARAVGVSPSWAVLTEAKLLRPDIQVPLQRTLSLQQAVGEALAANLELAAGQQELAAGAQQVRQARAQLLPQIGLEATGALLDETLASPIQPQRSGAGQATLTQLIYAEPARANLAIQRHTQAARQLEYVQLRLDIVHRTATSFLSLLRAQTFEQVQQDNLALTRTNLELARLRQTIGVSGRSEVLRWESQIATSRKRLIGANAQRNAAEIGLNRLLSRPQLEESFATVETGLSDPTFITHDKRFAHYMGNPFNFKIFRNFMAIDGLETAPELQRLDALLAAGERNLASARRAFWSPTLALQGTASSQFYESGKSSEVPLDDSRWTVGLSLNFPLYSGGAKFADNRRAAAELGVSNKKVVP